MTSLILSLLFIPSAHAHEASNGKIAYLYPIPTVQGKKLTGVVVTFPPGVKSSPHRHGDSFVVAYVLEGEVRSQVEGESVHVYKTGESWTEAPNAHHLISESNLKDHSAKIFAVFVSKDEQKEIVFPDKLKAASTTKIN